MATLALPTHSEGAPTARPTLTTWRAQQRGQSTHGQLNGASDDEISDPVVEAHAGLHARAFGHQTTRSAEHAGLEAARRDFGDLDQLRKMSSWAIRTYGFCGEHGNGRRVVRAHAILLSARGLPMAVEGSYFQMQTLRLTNRAINGIVSARWFQSGAPHTLGHSSSSRCARQTARKVLGRRAPPFPPGCDQFARRIQFPKPKKVCPVIFPQ